MIGLFLKRMMLLLLCSGAAYAGSDDIIAQQWLERLVNANATLNYQGLFTYINTNVSESFRVSHQVDGQGKATEVMQVMQGAPRQIWRSGNVVRIYLPDKQLVIVTDAPIKRSFLQRFDAAAVGFVLRYYQPRLEAEERIAGRMTQILALVPRDQWRFGYRLWVDRETGLLLKAISLDDKGKSFEQFFFNEVHFSPTVKSDDSMAMRAEKENWKIRQMTSLLLKSSDIEWRIEDLPPGYQPVGFYQRVLKRQRKEVMQIVLSDGLATMSVFVEAHQNTEHPPAALEQLGVISLRKEVRQGSLITVMGEVPGQTLDRVLGALHKSEE